MANLLTAQIYMNTKVSKINEKGNKTIFFTKKELIAPYFRSTVNQVNNKAVKPFLNKKSAFKVCFSVEVAFT